jgi:hypothetical protein
MDAITLSISLLLRASAIKLISIFAEYTHVGGLIHIGLRKDNPVPRRYFRKARKALKQARQQIFCRDETSGGPTGLKLTSDSFKQRCCATS